MDGSNRTYDFSHEEDEFKVIWNALENLKPLRKSRDRVNANPFVAFLKRKETYSSVFTFPHFSSAALKVNSLHRFADQKLKFIYLGTAY